MIAGIGTDIVSIARIRRALERHGDRFAHRILSEAETAVFGTRADPAPYLAKRFAAKEAFFKAFGQPSDDANTWHQLTVANAADGSPRLIFGDLLGARMATLGITGWHVTLSDEREHAVAFVVLEKGLP
jgi:holo-[acyl-carrier protein] synthase